LHEVKYQQSNSMQTGSEDEDEDLIPILNAAKQPATPMTMMAKAKLGGPPLSLASVAASSAAGGSGVVAAVEAAPQAPATTTLGGAGLGAGASAAAGSAAGGTHSQAQELTLCKQLILQLESRLRYLEHILLLKLVVPILFPPFQAALTTLKNYQTAAASNPRGHGLGPPHPHMFYYFLQALVMMPMAQNSDQGLRGRMLALLLLCVHIQKLSADAVDAFVPYFTIHQLSTPGMTDRHDNDTHQREHMPTPRRRPGRAHQTGSDGSGDGHVRGGQ